MKEIIAKGKIDGKDIEVRCLSDKNKFSFLFNGQDNKELEEKLKDMLRSISGLVTNDSCVHQPGVC